MDSTISALPLISDRPHPTRKPSKIVRAITNPSFGRLFEYKEPDPNASTKRIDDSKVAALFGAPNLDLSKGTTTNIPPPSTPALGTVETLSDPNEPLFDPELVSVEVEAKLPEGYRLRPLERADYDRGFLMVQSCLSSVGHVSEAKWNERVEWLRQMKDTYYVLCVVDDQDTVDIAVAKNQHGKNLGFRMLTALDFLAKTVGCYKTIVASSEANEAFHAQAGFRRKGLDMAHYLVRD
ncbi:MAG: hypothetical protein Q9165_005657 [Trypethelium subeluteriae]